MNFTYRFIQESTVCIVCEFQVNPKRTNRPGISTTDRGGSRGRGRGRGFRGGYYNPYNPYANYVPRPRGRAMFRFDHRSCLKVFIV